jgi:hypothetical protein
MSRYPDPIRELASPADANDGDVATWDEATQAWTPVAPGAASVPDASTTVKGKVELATDGETAAGVVVQGNDARLSNARTPTTHSHSTGDVTGLGTMATVADAPSDGTTYGRKDGAWAAAGGVGGGLTQAQVLARGMGA